MRDSFVVADMDRENLAPHNSAAGVNFCDGRSRVEKREFGTVGKKKQVLDFMDQSLKLGRVPELTRSSPMS